MTKTELEEIRSMVEEKNELEGLMRRYGYTPRFVIPDGMPHGSTVGNPTERIATKRLELRDLWDSKLCQLSVFLYEAEKELNILPSIQRRIVRFYYFDGISDKRIANKVNLNVDVVGRKRRDAINILSGEKNIDK